MQNVNGDGRFNCAYVVRPKGIPGGEGLAIRVYSEKLAQTTTIRMPREDVPKLVQRLQQLGYLDE